MLQNWLRFLAVIFCFQSCYGMTMKQIRQTGKTLRKTCLPKSNAEEAKIDVIKDGTFIEEKEVMCYTACIMKMVNMIKNGKVSYEAALKQVDTMLPDELKEPAKLVLGVCRKVPDGYKDLCEASFHMTKCIYNANPEIFYFP